MAIVAPIAGAYTGTYSGNPLNYTQRGYTLHFTQHGQKINETDLYGRSLVEIVYLGASMTIETVCKVYGSAVVSALWGWESTFGNVYSGLFPISSLASQQGAPLVLTSVAGTPAASSPATFTAGLCIVSPDQDLSLVFNSESRDVPLRFDVLLVDVASTGSLFSVS